MKLKICGLIFLPLIVFGLFFCKSSALASEIQWHSYDSGMARGKFEKKRVSNFYQVQGLPDSIFIAEDGEIIGRRPGYITAEQLNLIIESILAMRSQK